jgi:hypothetical protein
MQKTITSNLDKARSKIAIEKAMEDYKARFAEYSPRYDWTTADSGEFSFNAKGVKLAGTITVRDNFVDVTMDVPFLFRIFQGKALEVIQEQVELWVERVRSGKV